MEHPDIVNGSVADKMRYVYHTARTEGTDASLTNHATTVAAMTGLGFEWGTGNETLLAMVSSNVHEATENPLITGIATGAVSFGEQSTIGMLMAATIASYPRVAGAIREVTTGNADAEQTGPRSKMSRFAGVMIAGSAVELAYENTRVHHSRSANIRRAVTSSAIIAVANTAIFSGVSAMAKVGAENGFESQVDTAVDVASNPLTYVGVFAGVVGYKKLRKFIQRVRQQKPKAEDSYIEHSNIEEGTSNG